MTIKDKVKMKHKIQMTKDLSLVRLADNKLGIIWEDIHVTNSDNKNPERTDTIRTTKTKIAPKTPVAASMSSARQERSKISI